MAEIPEDAHFWIGLTQIAGLGGETFRRLLYSFGTPEQIFATKASSLGQIVTPEIAGQISKGPDMERLKIALEWLHQPHNHLITLADPGYPASLLEIPDPPPLLYVKGNPSLLCSPMIGIVGSRNATPQGARNATSFAQSLSESGWCIASGLALGIDGAAHRGALLGKGSTVAVVGTGLDIVYPARHRELAHEISEKGAIVSELPLGEPSRAHNFPRRNRIISGLSRGVLIVEANLESGSLITARLAAEQGREVFAIPGSIHSPLSRGCHRLIKQGAKLVESIQDILEEIGEPPAANPLSDSTSVAHPLLEIMGYDAISFDALIESSSLTSNEVSAMLLSMELEGKIASLPGGRYQRIV